MTLFNGLTPQAEQIIRDHLDLVNKNIEKWVKSEIQPASKEFCEQVLQILGDKKSEYGKTGVNYKLTVDRMRKIKKLHKEGHQIDQFRAVINHKVEQWIHEHPEWCYPETLFGQKFQKYLEEAREQWKSKQIHGHAGEYH